MARTRKLTEAEAKAVERAAPDEPRAGFAATIGSLGDQPELRTISAIVVAGGLLTANGRLFRAGIRMLLAHEIATSAKDFIKSQVDRTRPRSASSHRQRRVKLGRHTGKEMTSFP